MTLKNQSPREPLNKGDEIVYKQLKVSQTSSSAMACIVLFQFCIDYLGRQTVKELSIVEVDFNGVIEMLFHGTYQPPHSWALLDETKKAQNRTLTEATHGLDWGTGTLPAVTAHRTLTSLVRGRVFAKGPDQCRFLARILQRWVDDLEEFSAPPATELPLPAFICTAEHDPHCCTGIRALGLTEWLTARPELWAMPVGAMMTAPSYTPAARWGQESAESSECQQTGADWGRSLDDGNGGWGPATPPPGSPAFLFPPDADGGPAAPAAVPVIVAMADIRACSEDPAFWTVPGPQCIEELVLESEGEEEADNEVRFVMGPFYEDDYSFSSSSDSDDDDSDVDECTPPVASPVFWEAHKDDIRPEDEIVL